MAAVAGAGQLDLATRGHVSVTFMCGVIGSACASAASGGTAGAAGAAAGAGWATRSMFGV